MDIYIGNNQNVYQYENKIENKTGNIENKTGNKIENEEKEIRDREKLLLLLLLSAL